MNELIRAILFRHFGVAFIFLLITTASHAYQQDAALKKNIDSIVLAIQHKNKLPGLSVGVVKGDSILYSKGFGVKSIKSKGTVTENSIFHTASVSKLFTAQAIMHLVRDCKMTLDDKLVSIIPSIKISNIEKNEITIKMLLNHTSGIPDISNYHWAKHHQADNSLNRYITSKTIKLKSKPGTQYAYSNLAYDILGLVIENISRQSFEEYVKANVLLPAGMVVSDFNYYKIPDSLKVAPHSRRGIHKKIEQRKDYPYTREHSPSSTLNSSAIELSKWMMSFLKEFDHKDTNLLMTQPSTSINGSIGLGFQLYSVRGKKSFGHFGGDKGFRSYLVMTPEEKLGFVVLANCDFNEDFRQETVGQLVSLLSSKK